jgi:hypothetical protein
MTVVKSVGIVGSSATKLFLNGLPTKPDGTALAQDKQKAYIWIDDGAGNSKKGTIITTGGGITLSSSTTVATLFSALVVTTSGTTTATTDTGLYELTIDGTSPTTIPGAGYTGILKMYYDDDDDDDNNYLMYIVLIVLVVYLMNKRR